MWKSVVSLLQGVYSPFVWCVCISRAFIFLCIRMQKLCEWARARANKSCICKHSSSQQQIFHIFLLLYPATPKIFPAKISCQPERERERACASFTNYYCYKKNHFRCIKRLVPKLITITSNSQHHILVHACFRRVNSITYTCVCVFLLLGVSIFLYASRAAPAFPNNFVQKSQLKICL